MKNVQEYFVLMGSNFYYPPFLKEKIKFEEIL